MGILQEQTFEEIDNEFEQDLVKMYRFAEQIVSVHLILMFVLPKLQINVTIHLVASVLFNKLNQVKILQARCFVTFVKFRKMRMRKV